MADTLTLHTSWSFDGTIWNLLADGHQPRLYVEVRNPAKKQVTFAALNAARGEWLWQDLRFEEPWWISLAAIAGDAVLFTLYTDTNNPDQKSLIAYHAIEKRIAWWYNGFSLSAANRQYVSGVDLKFPSKQILLDAFTGKPVKHSDFDLADSQNFPVIRPFQYEAGSGHFETVSKFLHTRVRILPVITIEYLEFGHLIIVSVFVKHQDLANYLYVFNAGGELVLEEALGENLKGVGLDTFFIFSGQLMFVRNKNELKSYTIL